MLKIGFMLRKSVLVNSMLFSVEAWSSLSENNKKRLKVVEMALFRNLTEGH